MREEIAKIGPSILHERKRFLITQELHRIQSTDDFAIWMEKQANLLNYLHKIPPSICLYYKANLRHLAVLTVLYTEFGIP